MVYKLQEENIKIKNAQSIEHNSIAPVATTKQSALNNSICNQNSCVRSHLVKDYTNSNVEDEPGSISGNISINL